MDVIINEIVSTVKMSTSMDPHAIENMVRACLSAVKAQKEHEDRAREERRVTGGVRDETEGNG